MLLGRVLGIVCLVAVGLAACGDDGGGGAPAPSTTPTDPVVTSGESEPPTTLAENGAGSGDLRAALIAGGVGEITLHSATEGGPHPTLAWDPVEGATGYQLFVHDGEGRPYWAWSGSDTSTRLGGGDRVEANQTALLHEPMTWSVVAFDAEGGLVAVSAVAPVAP